MHVLIREIGGERRSGDAIGMRCHCIGYPTREAVGYVEGLGKALVATSPTYGWRDTVAVRDTFAPTESEYLAIAERSVVVGYEWAVATAWLK